MTIGSGRIAVGLAGGYAFTLRDVHGRTVRSFSGEGARKYRVADLLAGARPGLYGLRVEGPEGVFTGQVPYFP